MNQNIESNWDQGEEDLWVILRFYALNLAIILCLNFIKARWSYPSVALDTDLTGEFLYRACRRSHLSYIWGGSRALCAFLALRCTAGSPGCTEFCTGSAIRWTIGRMFISFFRHRLQGSDRQFGKCSDGSPWSNSTQAASIVGLCSYQSNASLQKTQTKVWVVL